MTGAREAIGLRGGELSVVFDDSLGAEELECRRVQLEFDPWQIFTPARQLTFTGSRRQWPLRWGTKREAMLRRMYASVGR